MTKLWFVPLILSVLCSLFNSYSGTLCFIIGVIGLLMLFFMDKKIHKDIEKMKNEESDIKRYDIAKTLSNTWFLTSFAFTLINALLSIFMYFLSFRLLNGETPMVFSEITLFAENYTLCKAMFLGSIVSHTISTILVYLENTKLYKQFKK